MKIKILFLFMLIKTSVSFGQSELDKLVDAWHLAASNASFDSYFEVVTDDFVFLGTAPGERWTKDQFAAFSKPCSQNVDFF